MHARLYEMINEINPQERYTRGEFFSGQDQASLDIRSWIFFSGAVVGSDLLPSLRLHVGD